MAPVPLLDDHAIEAIIRGDDVAAEVAHLAAFAAQVRAVGQGPPPRPTPALARLIAEGGPRARRSGLLAKAAGLSLVAKVALGAAATTAAAAGAGATGVLPGPAGRVMRDAIEVVSPVDFGDRDDGGGDVDAGRRHGESVSSDATGATDDRTGVDGADVARTAPGQPPTPGASPAQPGGPGEPATPPVTLPGASLDARAEADPPPVASTVPTPPTTDPPEPDRPTVTTAAPAGDVHSTGATAR